MRANVLAVVVPMVLLATWVGTTGAAAEEDTPLARARAVVKDLAPATAERGYRFEGSMRRPEGASVGAFSLQAEPTGEGDGWRTRTSLRWTSYPKPAEGGVAWAPADHVDEIEETLSRDLTSQSGRQRTPGDGGPESYAWTRAADGYRIERTGADGQTSQGRLDLRDPCLAGMASAVLLGRLLPRDSTDYEVTRLLLPSDLVTARLNVLGVRKVDFLESQPKAWIVAFALGGGISARVAYQPETREVMGIEVNAGGERVRLVAGASATPEGATGADRMSAATAGFPEPTEAGALAFEGLVLAGGLEMCWIRLSVAPGEGGWRIVEESLAHGIRLHQETFADRGMRAVRGTAQMVEADGARSATFRRSDRGYRLVRITDEAEEEGESAAPGGAVAGLASLVQAVRFLPKARATYEVPVLEASRFAPRVDPGIRTASIEVLGDGPWVEGSQERPAWLAIVQTQELAFLVAFDPERRTLLGLRGAGVAGFAEVRTLPTPAAAAAAAAAVAEPASPAAPQGPAIYLVEWRRKGSGQWHRAFVVKQEGDKYLVEYEGEGEYSREWATADRMRPVGGAPPVAGGASAAPAGSPAGTYAFDLSATNAALKDTSKQAASGDWHMLQRIQASIALTTDGKFRFQMAHAWTKAATAGTGTWKADGARIELKTLRIDDRDLAAPVVAHAAFDGTTLELELGTGANYPFVFKKK
jgi:hypothetical protein